MTATAGDHPAPYRTQIAGGSPWGVTASEHDGRTAEVRLFQSILMQALHDAVFTRSLPPHELDAARTWLVEGGGVRKADRRMFAMACEACAIDPEKVVEWARRMQAIGWPRHTRRKGSANNEPVVMVSRTIRRRRAKLKPGESAILKDVQVPTAALRPKPAPQPHPDLKGAVRPRRRRVKAKEALKATEIAMDEAASEANAVAA